MITAEDVQALYWKTQSEQDWYSTVGKPEVQEQQQLACWEAVIQAIRNDYQTELERLRDENRELRNIILERVTADAA